MMFTDTQIVHTKTIYLKEALLVLATMLFLFIILLLPVYQASVMRELTMKLSQSEQEMIYASEQEHLLRAYIAKSSIPDIASTTAQEKEIVLHKIPFNKAKLVIIKEDVE